MRGGAGGWCGLLEGEGQAGGEDRTRGQQPLLPRLERSGSWCPQEDLLLAGATTPPSGWPCVGARIWKAASRRDFWGSSSAGLPVNAFPAVKCRLRRDPGTLPSCRLGRHRLTEIAPAYPCCGGHPGHQLPTLGPRASVASTWTCGCGHLAGRGCARLASPALRAGVYCRGCSRSSGRVLEDLGR